MPNYFLEAFGVFRHLMLIPFRFGASITNVDSITITVPLILKVRDIIFFSWAKHIMGHFAGFFKRAKTFLTPKLS
jgi:hypothetical protein